MTTSDGSDTFYGGIPVFRGFSSLMDPALYSPLPDDWTIGIADIVESTKAIAEARYKAVNMAGASVIAAVTRLRCSTRVATVIAPPARASKLTNGSRNASSASFPSATSMSYSRCPTRCDRGCGPIPP